ncbi:MAG TPA: signal peptidase II [Burkholderiales bacterium]
MSRAWPWFAGAAAIVAADQLTKAMILARFAPGERLEVTSFFNLVLAFNKGAAFSLLAQAPGWQTPVLVAIALAAAAILSALIVRNLHKRLLCTGLALVLGGALGNLVDRLRLGHVVDFIDLHAAGWHWPAFNVADSGITMGAAILILEGFLGHEGRARAVS